MNLNFKYTDRLVKSLINIEKYNTSLEYLYLPTRVKQKMIYEAKLKKTHFSTSIEGNILSYNQVAKVIENKDIKARINPEQEVKNYWNALTFLEESKKNNVEITQEFIFKLHGSTGLVENSSGMSQFYYHETGTGKENFQWDKQDVNHNNIFIREVSQGLP